MRTLTFVVVLNLGLLAVAACGSDGGNEDPALFPANYVVTY
jgi:hypothetical protein